MNSSKSSFWSSLKSLFVPSSKSETDDDAKEEETGFDEPFLPLKISEHAKKVARNISLESERPNPIFLHSIMPRSGSVFVGNVIALHPDVAEYPNEIWETPFLESKQHLDNFSEHFFSSYSKNKDKIGRDDFFAIFGAAFQRYLCEGIPQDKVPFIKEPRTRFLPYFYEAFPNANLVLLVRDGRDLVNSTIKSWPHFKFEDVCKRWAKCARICLKMNSMFQNNSNFLLAKFEDVSSNAESFVNAFCSRFGLDPGRYPLEKTSSIPVQGSSTIKPDGEVSWDPVEKSKEFNPVGRWENWTDQQLKCFETIAGAELRQLGYGSETSDG